MDRKTLAHEIRSAGNAIRFADGPVIRFTTVNGIVRNANQGIRKLKLPDEEIIRYAATCSTCDAEASQFDIEFAAEIADCYQSFARLIWPCISHQKECPAQPYISVSKAASKQFQKIKDKFDARRQAWAEAKAKMTPEELQADRRSRRNARKAREKEFWEGVLSQAQKALKQQEELNSLKPKTKKAKPAKKLKKTPAKKKSAKKKSTKRKQ